ncbi:phosphoglycerate kinase [Candidatus Woesearchaeota archaeon]|nr:phosphoglycerate kinase [Candidatus Woesearchaeota archaeon]
MIRSVLKAPIRNKRVLVRVDFNVPLQNGHIIDDGRIVAALPTIRAILRKKPKQLILMSHLGRPEGVIDSLRMRPIAKRLETLLDKKVHAAPDCINVDIAANKIVLLENLRFHAGEEANNPQFAKQLAALADIYVNDAFGTSHRKHASVHAITRHLPAYAGLLLLAEQQALAKAAERPKHPYIAIIGGGKADKIKILESLLKRVDTMIVVGVLANIILAARGIRIGTSNVDHHAILLAMKIAQHPKIITPIDVVVAKSIHAQPRTCSIRDINHDERIVDIGPRTAQMIAHHLKSAKTIFWAGPAGLYEQKPYDQGSIAIATEIARSKATSIIGGGDTAAIIHKLKLQNRVTHISTGGGASIEYLKGSKLPGIEALT